MRRTTWRTLCSRALGGNPGQRVVEPRTEPAPDTLPGRVRVTGHGARPWHGVCEGFRRKAAGVEALKETGHLNDKMT